jgi:hypothetical protein
MRTVLLVVRMFLVMIVAISTLLVHESAMADEVRIVDNHGLTRALKVIESSRSKVVVTVASSQDSVRAVLQRSDTLGSDILGALQENTITFADVPAGTWQLVVTPALSIQSVKVVALP